MKTHYKGYLIEHSESPFKYEITDTNDCDASMLYANTLEEAKELIDELCE